MTFILRTVRAVRKGDRVQIPDSHIKGTVSVLDTARDGDFIVLTTNKGATLVPEWAGVWVGR